MSQTAPSSLWLLALLFILASPVWAVPANDHFSNRIDLGNAANVNATGDNTGGTLEPGEVNPAGFYGLYGGASVWYDWTAPTTGWVTIHTSTTVPANELDTVLLLASGSSLATLTVLGHNDESNQVADYENYATQSGASRLTFKATAGVHYQIAVHGHSQPVGESSTDQKQGLFNLTISSISTPAVVIQNLSGSPDPVDVTTTAQPVTFQAAINSSTSLFSEHEVRLMIYQADFLANDEVLLSAANRTSGTDLDGIYQGSLTVPVRVPGGEWPLVVSVKNVAANAITTWSAQGEDDWEDDYLIPGSSNRSITVTNSGDEDSQPPILMSFSASETVFNKPAMGSQKTVNLSLRVTDDHGVDSGEIAYRDSADHEHLVSFTSAQRTSGDALDGTYQVSLVFPDTVVAGHYHAQVLVEDESWNQGHAGALLGDELLTQASISVIAGSTLPFSAWKSVHFSAEEQADNAVSGPLADPDRDGIANSLEYALSLNPLQPGPSSVMSAIGQVHGFDAPAMSFRLPVSLPEDTAVFVEYAEVLGSAPDWQIIASKFGTSAWETYFSNSSIVTEEPAVSGFVPVKVVSPYQDVSELGFLRLRIRVP